MAKKKIVDVNSLEYKVGQNIQSIRKKRKISQTKLGSIMGMDRAAISHYESGTNGEMGIGILQRFASALSVTTSELMGDAKAEAKHEEDILFGLNDENKEMIMRMAAALLLQQKQIA